MDKKICKNCKRLIYYDGYYCDKHGLIDLSFHCKYYKNRKTKFWLNKDE